MSKRKSLIDEDGEVRELTLEDMKLFKPMGEVFPGIVEACREGRLKVRGPQKAPTKERVALRLFREVVDCFRATGTGWQTRIDGELVKVVHKHKEDQLAGR